MQGLDRCAANPAVVDHKNFRSLGAGLWWAVQTVTTVGYGDHVPDTIAGRLLATVVMLFGIGFLTVITATIASSFVARSRLKEAPTTDPVPTAGQLRQIDTRLERIEADQLRQIDTRLERIEAALTRHS